MDFKKSLVVLTLFALANMVNAQLNGTEVVGIIQEAFIIIGGTIDEVVGIIPGLIELAIYFAIMGTVVGIFAVFLLMVKSGVTKGNK